MTPLVFILVYTDSIRVCVCVYFFGAHTHSLLMYLMGILEKYRMCVSPSLILFSPYLHLRRTEQTKQAKQTNTCSSHRKGWQVWRVMTIMTGTEPQSLSRVTHNKAHSVRLKFYFKEESCRAAFNPPLGGETERMNSTLFQNISSFFFLPPPSSAFYFSDFLWWRQSEVEKESGWRGLWNQV